MKTFNLISYILLIAVSLGATSCFKNKTTSKPEITPPVFNFETTELCNINLDLGLKGYPIIVELYTKKPLTEDGEKIEGMNPIYRGITDENGKLTDDVVDLPKGTDMVYFYTTYIGIQNMIPIKVVGKDITFAVNTPITNQSATRFATKANTYPDPDRTIILPNVTWDRYGIPSNLESRESIPAGLYYDIRQVINGNENGARSYLDKNYSTELNLVKETGVKIVFVNETASMRNTVCYYHYPTGQKPTKPEDIKMIIAFPNASFPEYNVAQPTGLSSGDNIIIKYWDGEKFVDKFPANTTIAFAMMSNTFSSNVMGRPLQYYYADHSLNVSEENADSKEHVIVLHHKSSDTYVHMIEDRIRERADAGNFHDAVLYFKTDVKDAIEGNIPELPETGEKPSESSTDHQGTVIFEDNWPYQGDYDMNDVAIEYFSTVYKDKNNKVVKLVDVMKVVNDKFSNTQACQFGYQFNTNSNNIKSVTITPEPVETDKDTKGLEPQNDTPTVILFKNNMNNIGATFTVTTLIANTVDSKYLIPPYNPFIAISDRGREVHLTMHAPTPRADFLIFGQGNDDSKPEQKIYYVSKNRSFPFAIKIPIRGFILPTETKRIDEIYPGFSNWVESGSNEDEEWYTKPKVD